MGTTPGDAAAAALKAKLDALVKDAEEAEEKAVAARRRAQAARTLLEEEEQTAAALEKAAVAARQLVPGSSSSTPHTSSATSSYEAWRRMDSVVLNWISISITPELHQVVRERGATARHLWLAIENQFLGNREQRTLHLDAAFVTLWR
jgi:hypothetical protein